MKLQAKQGGWSHERQLIKAGVIPGAKDQQRSPNGREYRLNARQYKKSIEKITTNKWMCKIGGRNVRACVGSYMLDMEIDLYTR